MRNLINKLNGLDKEVSTILVENDMSNKVMRKPVQEESDEDISKGFGAGYSDGFAGKIYSPPDGMSEQWYEGYRDGWDEASSNAGHDGGSYGDFDDYDFESSDPIKVRESKKPKKSAYEKIRIKTNTTEKKNTRNQSMKKSVAKKIRMKAKSLH